jgi:adenosine kinase
VCAPNIAYTLALLGERPAMMGTAGQDFDEYRQFLESAGVDASLVKQVPGKFTASFFCSTDRNGNQIASFYTGAMAHASELSFASAGPCDRRSPPNDLAAMVAYARAPAARHPLHLRPEPAGGADGGGHIKDGVVGAHIVICNDMSSRSSGRRLARERHMPSTSPPPSSLRARRGRRSCRATGRSTPAVPPTAIVIRRVGDAFRGGS